MHENTPTPICVYLKFHHVLTKTCRTIAIYFCDCNWGLSRRSFIHVSRKLSVLLRTHFLFALAIFLFSWFFLSLITIIPIEAGMLLSKITKESKKKSLSLSLVIDKKKKNQDLTVKERRAAQPDLQRSRQARMKKESHRWQHLSHIQTRLFSSLLRVTSFFFSEASSPYSPFKIRIKKEQTRKEKTNVYS